jgi:two-component system chemotaxis response regulator CheY
MMTGNADPCGRTALPGADAVPTAPHVLIAEDHPAIQELLGSVLQLAGYRTTACAGRQAALTWIDRTMPGDCPALILLDLSIPCTNDAADFLSHLRARWHDACSVLPEIIVLTTCKKVQEDLMPMECVVLKPFHVRDLIALIQRVVPFAPRSIPEGLIRESR